MQAFWFPSRITTVELRCVGSTTLSAGDRSFNAQQPMIFFHDCRLSIGSPGHPPLSTDTARRNDCCPGQDSGCPG